MSQDDEKRPAPNRIEFTMAIEMTIPPQVTYMAEFIRNHALQIKREAELGNDAARQIIEIVEVNAVMPKPGCLRDLMHHVERYQSIMVCSVCGTMGYRHLCN